MSKYPKLTSENFNSQITKKFNKFKIPKKNESMKEICFPKEFKLQIQQKFVKEFMNPKTPYKGLLLYHKIGAGKTCAAVQITEQFKHSHKLVVVVPAALIGNFRNELRSFCGGYLSDKEEDEIHKLNPKDSRYKQLIKESDKRIDKHYTIYSYHKFVELIIKRKIKLHNTVLVIDEIQNMISEKGTFYKELYGLITNAPDDLRLVLMSATPMFDKPVELAMTVNLLRPKKELPIGKDFIKTFTKVITDKNNNKTYQIRNIGVLKKIMVGFISYYRGANPVAFPKEKFKIVKCTMSSFQYKSYLASLSDSDNYIKGSFRNVDLLDLPQNFFLGARVISNVAFPNRKTNDEGFSSFKGDKLQMDLLEEYSCKFYQIMRRIRKTKGLVFIYSGFKEFGGLKSFIRVLEHHGYKNYKGYGEGKKRFAVWHGDEKHNLKEAMKKSFNNKDNVDGSRLKIMLGSPSIKEGVSLLRVSQVHILEPYWNMSRLLQIIGRANRFCSHKDVAKEDRVVNVYLYMAVHKEIGEGKSVDEYIWQLAKSKQHLINDFEQAMKEVSIDCQLFKNSNVRKGDSDIKCVKKITLNKDETDVWKNLD